MKSLLPIILAFTTAASAQAAPPTAATLDALLLSHQVCEMAELLLHSQITSTGILNECFEPSRSFATSCNV